MCNPIMESSWICQNIYRDLLHFSRVRVVLEDSGNSSITNTTARKISLLVLKTNVRMKLYLFGYASIGDKD